MLNTFFFSLVWAIWFVCMYLQLPYLWTRDKFEMTEHRRTLHNCIFRWFSGLHCSNVNVWRSFRFAVVHICMYIETSKVEWKKKRCDIIILIRFSFRNVCWFNYFNLFSPLCTTLGGRVEKEIYLKMRGRQTKTLFNVIACDPAPKD